MRAGGAGPREQLLHFWERGRRAGRSARAALAPPMRGSSGHPVQSSEYPVQTSVYPVEFRWIRTGYLCRQRYALDIHRPNVWICTGHPVHIQLLVRWISTFLIDGCALDVQWISTAYPSIRKVDIHYPNSCISTGSCGGYGVVLSSGYLCRQRSPSGYPPSIVSGYALGIQWIPSSYPAIRKVDIHPTTAGCRERLDTGCAPGGTHQT